MNNILKCMPYGMAKKEKHIWEVFDRGYSTLYVFKTSSKEKTIANLSRSTSAQFDEDGKIIKLWFYDGGTSPYKSMENLRKYFDVLTQLKNIKVNEKKDKRTNMEFFFEENR